MREAAIMKWRVFIEGMVLIVMGIVGLTEGIRLIIIQDPRAFYDAVGPNRYLLGVSIALIITGAIHIYHHSKRLSVEKLKVDKKTIILAIKLIIILTVNVFLIEVVGYFPATAVFFLLILRVLGITSWLKNVILTIIFSASFYIIFVYLLNMAFPRGILFP